MNEDFIETISNVILGFCLLPVGIVLVILMVFAMLARALGEFIKDIYDDDMYWGGKE